MNSLENWLTNEPEWKHTTKTVDVLIERLSSIQGIDFCPSGKSIEKYYPLGCFKYFDTHKHGYIFCNFYNIKHRFNIDNNIAWLPFIIWESYKRKLWYIDAKSKDHMEKKNHTLLFYSIECVCCKMDLSYDYTCNTINRLKIVNNISIQRF